jgi:hypothetical protein
MPHNSDKSTGRLSLEAQFLSRPIIELEELEAAIISTFSKGFDGDEKSADVPRTLDEEIVMLIHPERGF